MVVAVAGAWAALLLIVVLALVVMVLAERVRRDSQKLDETLWGLAQATRHNRDLEQRLRVLEMRDAARGPVSQPSQPSQPPFQGALRAMAGPGAMGGGAAIGGPGAMGGAGLPLPNGATLADMTARLAGIRAAAPQTKKLG